MAFVHQPHISLYPEHSQKSSSSSSLLPSYISPTLCRHAAEADPEPVRCEPALPGAALRPHHQGGPAGARQQVSEADCGPQGHLVLCLVL